MRKTVLLVACIIGSAALTSGQTVITQFHVTALSREKTAEIVTFRGSVRMVLDSTTITADEVDARMTPNGLTEYDLRGNVHVTLTPTR